MGDSKKNCLNEFVYLLRIVWVFQMVDLFLNLT